MSAKCRACGSPLEVVFVDLGVSPIANAFLKEDELNRFEVYYPLRAYVCTECFLVQLEEFETPEALFSDYAYFSSYSTSWLEHAKAYTQRMTRELALGADSLVIELASNDGYLLKNFVQCGVPVLGVEPAKNVAQVAIDAGVPTITEFFSAELADQLARAGRKASLIVANNVLAHVPDLNGFVRGMKLLLRREGTITVEVPHLLRLIQGTQFDTIYHEHFSYFSLVTLQHLFRRHGLAVVDVDRLSTHGGSLRVHARHEEGGYGVSDRVSAILAEEKGSGLDRIETYRGFQGNVNKLKRELLRFLIDAKAAGKRVAAYGAPAKGNTLLNYAGIRTDFIDYTVDLSPHKQGRYLPGSRIPIHPPGRIRETRPDFVLLLAWNLREEIEAQLSYIQEWNGALVVPVPTIEIVR